MMRETNIVSYALILGLKTTPPISEQASETTSSTFDYPLPLDQMKNLWLRTVNYTDCMGGVLTFLHWKVGVDKKGGFFLGGIQDSPSRFTMGKFWGV